jgi:hypothetical protein
MISTDDIGQAVLEHALAASVSSVANAPLPGRDGMPQACLGRGPESNTKSMNLLRRIPVLIMLLGLVAALLSILGTFLRWCAVVAGMLTAIVVIVQFKAQGNTTIQFATGDWQKIEDSFQFSAGRYHGKGLHPNVAVFQPSGDGGYKEVFCDVQTLESGEVLIEATTPFTGEVRIS